jgi:hypothetical protein
MTAERIKVARSPNLQDYEVAFSVSKKVHEAQQTLTVLK